MTLRIRLTLLYTLLFGACGAVLLALSSWLVHRHVERTLPPGFADPALSRLNAQYALALAGTALVAAALGYVVAGRALAPLRRVTGLARRVTQERMNERIAMIGPVDELRELADTVDGMLDRLTEAFEGQRRFVANASHELRTPLTVMRTEVDVTLGDPVADVAELRRMAEVVRAATQRADGLVEGLLTLAHTEAAGVSVREPADLALAAKTAVAAIGPEAAARSVRITVEGGAAPVLGDPALLDRVAGNLLENAVRHNVDGGWVTVWTGTDADASTLRVGGSGAVVAPERVAELFEPFRRGVPDRTGGGTGLGLSIVRAVVRAHGGTVHAEPVPGGGLTVTVRLPPA